MDGGPVADCTPISTLSHLSSVYVVLEFFHEEYLHLPDTLCAAEGRQSNVRHAVHRGIMSFLSQAPM